ncbi:hypothetical protein CYY_009302 [Polysphondylium violaceum]|uniref:Ribosome recycling factor domain-containing protein n=1 Tax=Polysphondylium violaceum TaxID=133409 RepID=A0A8J4V0L2_9MYCE|nr:hypothetical protein CYY_009302 [Polysphondylium violaceum]
MMMIRCINKLNKINNFVIGNTVKRSYGTSTTLISRRSLTSLCSLGEQSSSALSMTSTLQRAAKKGGKGDKKGAEETPYDKLSAVDLNPMKEQCERTMEFLFREFGNIRFGRAGPELLERINVETPSGPMQLSHISMITIKDPLTLHITLYDTELVKAVEKAIQTSNLEITPIVQGSLIRVSLPKPTQELRAKLVKQVNSIAEEAKVSIRRHRKDGNDLMKRYKLVKDDERTLEKNIQKVTDDYVAKITKSTDSKLKEINQ